MLYEVITQLHDYVEPLPAALPANMSLDLAIEHESWRAADYVPVVDRQGQLIGILRYADRITSYNVCYTKLLRSVAQSIESARAR